MKDRILLVFDKGLGHGGVESVIMSIVRNLNSVYTFDLLTNTSIEKAHDKEFIRYGGRILRIPFYEGGSRFRQRADYYVRGKYLYEQSLKVIHENMPYKVIHCNNGVESGVILSAAKKLGIPVRVAHSHAVFSPDSSVRKIITEHYRREISKNATCLIGCSEFACSLFLNSQYNRIVYNSYDEEKFVYQDVKDIKEHSLKLIQVGRYDKNKNQIFSLKILKEILKVFPDATLDLVGSNGGAEEISLRTVANELGITDSVLFYRSNADILALLSQSDAFLFPSLSEGFGISLIEAQAAGIKCYASDTVPKITNCGGVDYLPLFEHKWAKRIITDFKSNVCAHRKYDCSMFLNENVMQEYLEIYRGD